MENYKEKFLSKCFEKFGNKYDYSKVNYINNHTDVLITCPIHGEFLIKPVNHLKGSGCPKCSLNNSIKKIFKDVDRQKRFLERSYEVHGNRYDYSKSIFVKTRTPLIVICHELDEFGDEHGDFLISLANHLRGKGCPKCGGKKKLTTEDFIKKSILCHGENRYDYSLSEYKAAKNKVKIKCLKCGKFFEQIAYKHMHGSGCPNCRKSLLEEQLVTYLEKENVNYIQHYYPEWLNGKEIDVYLPDFQIGFECQGAQHFKPVQLFGGESEFERQIKRDKEKFNECEKNDIRLFYVIKDKQKNIKDKEIYKWYNTLRISQIPKFLIKFLFIN